ncbi:DUF3578 domain-containing protein [Pararhizobium sp. LjRoot235]|uniref:MrcB family domain-containing protein n=1 Tax=Pararhizobium sp. LjRoot235 TaxID=3342291 RepID=UPI003ECF5172
MALSDLTDPAAVTAALDEFDQLGRESFLQKYGFRPARAYFIRRNGKHYDSKAIVGAARGIQHSELGSLRSDEFSGGEQTVRALLERLGFEVVVEEGNQAPAITSRDIELMRQSRAKARYTDFSEEERSAYQRVHAALGELGHVAIAELGGPTKYVLKVTSGFHPSSGIRGGKPKDLWFGVYRRENEDPFLGNPQIFMIVSERGIEFGFGALTHPDDFSNQEIKNRVRAIAPQVLQLLPPPDSIQAQDLSARLTETGPWYFRRKQRLEPKQSEYVPFEQWLRFVRSPDGARNAGGGITQYLQIDEVDGANLNELVRQTVYVFGSLMEAASANKEHELIAISESPSDSADPDLQVGNREFADALGTFLAQFTKARAEPFQKTEILWAAMGRVKERLERFPAVQSRKDIVVSMSVGQGNWASVPWIALMNTKVTRSTQEGVYVVFLIAKNLERIFLTLNQGTTKLVNELGQTGAQARMEAVAKAARVQISDSLGSRYSLDNLIDLGATGWLARNYEFGTIAHTDLEASNLPSDEDMNEMLEAVLSAYDQVIDAPERPAPLHNVSDTRDAEENGTSGPEPYAIEDALDDIFMDRDALERLLAIWRSKKNLILQGAPGVGKSYVAKRLAQLLLGAKDASRIATIQFHQSYSYEDFVQGYRPDGAGGFELRNGIFHRFCEKADRSPALPHVFIIDEINRGNLSKILGELMLLVEHDKRGPGWATTLTYSKEGDAPFFVPDNIYILGMMNTADRSLSLVDYALRRRFSFASLDPMFNSPKLGALLEARGVPGEIVAMIVERMNALNHTIGDDRANLGPGYRIGHSFFVPPSKFQYDDGWYRRVIETEIYPLLEEYWFDDPDKALDWQVRLLTGAP